MLMDEVKIKKKIEDYLKYGRVFNYILKSNPSFYEDKLKVLFKNENLDSIENIKNRYYFKYNPSNLEFAENSIVREYKENELYEYLYISKFEFDGFINLNSSESIPEKVKITAKVIILTQNLGHIIDVMAKNSFKVIERKIEDSTILEKHEKCLIPLNLYLHR